MPSDKQGCKTNKRKTKGDVSRCLPSLAFSFFLARNIFRNLQYKICVWRGWKGMEEGAEEMNQKRFPSPETTRGFRVRQRPLLNLTVLSFFS